MCLTSEIPELGAQSKENLIPFLSEKWRNKHINLDQPPECGR